MAKAKDPADIGKEQGPDALRGITDRDPGLSFEREEPAPRPNGRRRKANGEDQARKRKGKARKATVDAHADGDGKPVIRIVAGEITRVIDEIERAVLAADLGLYQRAGCVARIETAVIAMPDSPKRKTLVIRSQEPEALREAMCIAAHFIKFDKRAGDWVDIDPPVQRAKDWLARRERMRLPILNGLMSAPLILPESKRIIETPGYDEATGLFFEPLGASFPEVPKKPTREDALAALELIRSLLTEFPFADARADENRERVGADESVMLSAIISAIMRAAIGNIPLHCFNAPAARTGKSLAATLVSVISQGRAPPLCTGTHLDDGPIELDESNGASIQALPLAPLPHCPLMATVWMLYEQRNITSNQENYDESQQTVRFIRDADEKKDVEIVGADEVSPAHWSIRILPNGEDRQNDQGPQFLKVQLKNGPLRDLVLTSSNQASKLAHWLRTKNKATLSPYRFNNKIRDGLNKGGDSLLPFKQTANECGRDYDPKKSKGLYQPRATTAPENGSP